MIQKFQKTERIFIPSYKEKTGTMTLEKFLMENFQVPDDDFEKICRFIRQDSGLEKIIIELPNLIQSEITYDKLQIKFYEEFQEDYLQLEINVFTPIDTVTSLKVEEKLEEKLYELYDHNSADKLLIIMEQIMKQTNEFDWREFNNLADSYIEQTNEAKQRTGVSRYYYDTFCTTRDFLNENDLDLRLNLGMPKKQKPLYSTSNNIIIGDEIQVHLNISFS